MSPLLTAVLLVLVFLVSLLYSAVGHAGASGDIAAMGLVGVPSAAMKPIALVLNLFVASIGTFRFYRAGYFSWRLFLPFTLASVPCASIAGLAGNLTAVHHLPPLVWTLVPAAVIGGLIGSSLGSTRLNPSAIRRLLSAALVIAGFKMIFV